MILDWIFSSGFLVLNEIDQGQEKSLNEAKHGVC